MQAVAAIMNAEIIRNLSLLRKGIVNLISKDPIEGNFADNGSERCEKTGHAQTMQKLCEKLS